MSALFRALTGTGGNNDQMVFTERTDGDDDSGGELVLSPTSSQSPLVQTAVTANSAVSELMSSTTESVMRTITTNSPRKDIEKALQRGLSMVAQGAYTLGESEGGRKEAARNADATRTDAKEERGTVTKQIGILQSLMVTQIGDLSEEVGRAKATTERVEKAYKEAIARLEDANSKLEERLRDLERKAGEQTGTAEGLEGRIKGLEESRSAVDNRMGTIEQLLQNTVVGQVMFIARTFTSSAVDMTFTKADSRILMIALAFAMVLHKNAAKGMLSRYSIAPIAAIFVPIAIVMLFAKTVATIKNEKIGDVFDKVNKVSSDRFTWIAVAALAISTALYSAGRQKNAMRLMAQGSKVA